MAKILIKDTTVSERAQIVREALGADSDCEGIDLTDINREFSEKHAGEVVAHPEETDSTCQWSR